MPAALLAPNATPFEGTDRKDFRIDIPFTKSSTTTKGDLILSGYASTWSVDRDGEFIAPTAFDESLPEYLAKNPIVLWQHDPCCPMGTVTKAVLDATGLYVEVTIPKPAVGEPDWLHLAYNRVARGVVKTFSIGGGMDRVWEETLMMPMVVRVDLFEISVVSIPANESSLFAAAIKAANGESASAPRLRGAIVEQMEAVLGMSASADPELLEVMADDSQKRLRYLELARIYESAGYDCPAVDEWTKACAATDPLERLDLVEGCIRKARGSVALSASGQKAGRVLSKANEDRLRTAVVAMSEAIKAATEILDQVAQDGDPASAEVPGKAVTVDETNVPPMVAEARRALAAKAAKGAALAAPEQDLDPAMKIAQMEASAAAIAAAAGTPNGDDA
jgi:HK97 family phage prohead protease